MRKPVESSAAEDAERWGGRECLGGGRGCPSGEAGRLDAGCLPLLGDDPTDPLPARDPTRPPDPSSSSSSSTSSHDEAPSAGDGGLVTGEAARGTDAGACAAGAALTAAAVGGSGLPLPPLTDDPPATAASSGVSVHMTSDASDQEPQPNLFDALTRVTKAWPGRRPLMRQ